MTQLIPIMDLSILAIVPSYLCTSANCLGCYQRSSKDYRKMCQDTLDLPALLPFIRRYVSTVRLRWFGIMGGEITEYDRCAELVRLLTTEFPGISLEIATNGQNHVRLGEILDATQNRRDLKLNLSIDGYGKTCDLLRGKDGYFEEAILSIDEVVKRGLTTNLNINVRYFPKHENSISELTMFLEDKYGVGRNQISLLDVTFLGGKPRFTKHDARSYIAQLRDFAAKFWIGSSLNPVPRCHPEYRPLDIQRMHSVCIPGVHPDGYVYTCFDYGSGMKVGNIGDTDVAEMVSRMLGVAKLNPEQCEKCSVGRCVLNHYHFQRPTGDTTSARGVIGARR